MNNKGFSLIEILISLGILAIGLLAIAGMQITSVRGNYFSSNMMQASIFGQDGLEYLKGLPILNEVWPNDLAIGDYNFGVTPGDDGIVHDSAGNDTIFSRTYRVYTDPGVPATSRIITVTVGWRETSDHSVSFSIIRSP